MQITRATNIRALLACGVLVAASGLLVGCGVGGSQPHAATSGTAVSANTPDASTEAIVVCYRAHGDPGFPDPVYDPGDGRWHFAISPNTAPASTRQACQHLFPSVNPSPPVPQAEFQQLVRLAECIRQHGVPTWPDPDPDGAFGLPPALQTKTPAYVRAASACRRYIPSEGINAYAAP